MIEDIENLEIWGGSYIGKKYIYKNKLPKQFSEKKPLKLIAFNRKSHRHFKERRSLKYTNIIQTLKKNKSTKNTSKWKLPTIIFILSLMMVILVIPSLIVIPFVKDVHYHSTAKEIEQEITIKQKASAPDLSVAVMRMSSDEVEDVPLEDYVIGVVAAEMPVAEFELEALKAQSLAARTYIVYHLLHQKDVGEGHVTDTTADQVYKNEDELRELWGANYNENMEKLTTAVTATSGKILTNNHAPIFPAFFSTSNGYTENSEDYWKDELPHLRSVPSPWDKESPQFLNQETFTIREVEDALNIELPKSSTLPIEVTRTEGKRVNELVLANNKFTGREIREKLGLKSSDFTIEQNNDHLIFTTKGYGHGIGMSQYGANGMAREGKTYEEIVKYYYQDIEISTITETAPTLVAR